MSNTLRYALGKPLAASLSLPGLLLFALLFWAAGVVGQTVVTYTSSGNFTVPPGVTSITVECWGGGGGGGNASHSGNGESRAGGGAGGAYTKKVVSVSPGMYTVTVGSGGAGGSAGGDSWFGTITTVIAKGGAPGGNASKSNAGGGNGTTTGSIGDVGMVFAGGNGGGGTNANGSGGGGGGAGSTGAGGNATNATAGTGTADNGGNGGAGVTATNNGNGGANYGGGGSGAILLGNFPGGDSRTGGTGGGGFVRITYCNPPADFTVSGGGTICAPATASVALSGSETGVNYQLFVTVPGPVTLPVGSPVAGDGNPLSFTGLSFGGVYTVVATNTTTLCSATMSGSATVTAQYNLVVEAAATGTCGDPITITVKSGSCGPIDLTSLQFVMQWVGAEFEYVAGSASGSTLPSPVLSPLSATTLRYSWTGPTNTVAVGATLLTFQLKPKLSTGSGTVNAVALISGDLIATQPNFNEIAIPTTGTTINFAASSTLAVPITVAETSDIPNDNILCPGASAQLTAAATGGTGPYTYVWNPVIGLGAGPHTVTPPNGPNTYNVTATDAFGCTVSNSVVVTVEDVTDPTITCAVPAASYNTNAGVCTYTVPDNSLNPTATGDNCSVASVLNNFNNSNTLNGAVFPLGSTVVTWTITDGSGNTATCTQTVTVVDAENPTITCAVPAASYNTNAGVCTYTVPDNSLNPTATGDNCSVASVVNNFNNSNTLNGAVFPLGSTVVTWTITDGSGNTATCTQTVTVVDAENPTITCAVPAASYNTNAGVCTYTVPDNSLNPTATGDNCSVASVLNSFNNSNTLNGAVFPLGSTVVTWTITDGSGNTATCTQTVTVVDAENPTITCAVPAASYNTNAGVCTYTVPDNSLNPTATGDNCSVASVLNNFNNSNTLNGAVFPLGSTVVTWTITDGSGNTATCTQTVTVVDAENPTITCAVPAASYNTNAGVCTYTVPDNSLNPTATGDNCSVASVLNNFNNSNTLNGAVFPLGSTVVTWTITDGSGNTATCTQTVTVVDAENPTITCAVPAASYNTNAGVCTYTVPDNSLNPTATGDNCSVASVLNNFNNSNTLNGAVFPLGSTVVTWTITDGSGNTATCTQTVTVVDAENPTITCAVPAASYNTNAGVCTYTVPDNSLNPTATGDNCSVASVLNNFNNSNTLNGAVFPLGSTVVTWTITDGSGNTATCTQTVTVVDAENPTITCAVPAASYNTNAGVCTYTVPDNSLNPTATGDNCSVASVLNNFNNSNTLNGAVFPLGSTVVTWTITDGSGNTATCTQTVTVVDAENPTITCAVPAASYNTNAGVCTYTVPDNSLNPTATGDNCSVASVLNNFNNSNTLNGAVFPLGSTVVTWTITDGSGNTATCTQTVTVVDAENPTITCAVPAASYNTNAGVCTYTVPDNSLNPTATGDNCSVASVLNNFNNSNTLNGAVFPLGSTVVTWTITDGSGNTATCTQTVTVVDAENPTITCAVPAASYNTNAGVCTYTVPDNSLNPTATGDNCSVASVLNNFNNSNTLNGAVFPLGSTVVTWTITDGSGNTATCTQTVTVVDAENPTITCAVPAASYNTNAGVCTYTVPDNSLNPTATGDNCSVASVLNNFNNSNTLNGAVFPLGSTVVTWTITDGSGNTATCTQTVTVVDAENPTITCAVPAASYNTNAGVCTYTVPDNSLNPTATGDNCSVASVLNNFNNSNTLNGAVFPLGSTVVTWTITDGSGNTATCTQTVTVVDNQAPIISACPSDITTGPDPGSCDAVVTWTEPTADDNCEGAMTYTTRSHAPGSTFPGGTTTVTYTFTDAGGNTATCTFDVTVNATCVTISGTLWHQGPGNVGVGQASVALSGDATDNFASTPAAGTYTVIANTGTDFTITPTKNINILNGVDVGDATAIQRHLVSLDTIFDFYRLIAADVNKSGNISTVDAAVIRQAILNNPAAIAIFNNTNSWRFVPTTANTAFSNGFTPPVITLPVFTVAFPETRELMAASGTATGEDFFGIKVGDVLENMVTADPANLTGQSQNPLLWMLQDRVLQAGEAVEVEFQAGNFNDLAAFQFGLGFDPQHIEFAGVEVLNSALPLSADGNFGTTGIEQGELRVAYAIATGTTLPAHTPVFKVRFTALSTGYKLSEVLGIDRDMMPAVAYSSALAASTVSVVYTETVTSVDDPGAALRAQLLQNRPNPFEKETLIGFVLPEACEAQLRVLDMSGRELWRVSKQYGAGYNEELLRLDAGFAQGGVLLYELRTPYGVMTRKMVMTR